MNPNEQIALWAEQLRDMSALGLTFSENFHDRENYHRIQQIAMQMMAMATGQPLEDMEALRTIVFDRPGPIPTADAAIFDEQGRILLIQRSDNHKWAMPGGSISAGETPSESAVREAKEETGVVCEPVQFLGVYDSRFSGSRSAHHLYHFVFLCRVVDAGGLQSQPSHAVEILDRAWFSETDLPAEISPGHQTRIADAFRAYQGQQIIHFE